jgi:hypothetical protein
MTGPREPAIGGGACMQENPYSAPHASIDERRDTPRRPASVKLAAASLICNFVVGQSKFLFIDIPTTGVMTVITFSFVVGLSALLVAAVLSRLNWARWVVAVLLGGSLAFFPFAIAYTSIPALRILLIAQAVFHLGTLVLMFVPPSGRWYRPNHASRPKPLRGSA